MRSTCVWCLSFVSLSVAVVLLLGHEKSWAAPASPPENPKDIYGFTKPAVAPSPIPAPPAVNSQTPAATPQSGNVVPSVIGLTPKDAVARLAEHELSLSRIEIIAAPAAEKNGLVGAQKPVAGDARPRDRCVILGVFGPAELATKQSTLTPGTIEVSQPLTQTIPTTPAIPRPTLAGSAVSRPTPATTAVSQTTPRPPGGRVLFSDSFNRSNAKECSLGKADLALGGFGRHFYIPLFPHGGKDPTRPIGALLVSGALQNNGSDFGGVQFTPASDDVCSGREPGGDTGSDINIRVDLRVPSQHGFVSCAGPFFRSRRAPRGDGIIGGQSAGYWVQLCSTGEVRVKRLNPQAFVATTGKPSQFDNTIAHALEVAVNESSLQVALDGNLLVFRQRGEPATTVAIPATDGVNGGAAGIAFSSEDNRGKAGGQRADNLVVTAYSSLGDFPIQDNVGRE